MTSADLAPRRHNPPAGWPPEVFEHVIDAIAAALLAAYQRPIDEALAIVAARERGARLMGRGKSRQSLESAP